MIGYTARGIISAEVTVRGPDHDLHSGGYGGVVHNPLHTVGKIIASFHDDRGRIQIPGYYDEVRELDEEERAQLLETYKITGPEFEAKSGVEHFWGESIAPVPVRATSLPTLDVNGISGGYQGPGMKTVIPSEASFKVTMRLVPNQDPAKIAELFKNYVESFASDTMQVSVAIHEKAWPVTMAGDGPSLEAVQRGYEDMIGRRALRVRVGGSIPILGMFQREMGMPITPLGYGSGENVHSPNEYVRLDHFFLSIEKSIRTFYYLAETMG
jgi:acetylornithine deacetylase/succinyl-diaminopimelate desuccinylase-like protein